MIRYKFSILTAILILLLSLIPGNNLPDASLFDFKHMDKLVHLGMYGCFSLALLSEIKCRKPCLFLHLFLLFLALLMSLFLEFIQALLVAGRSAEWTDLLANFLGLFSGYVLYRITGLVRS